MDKLLCLTLELGKPALTEVFMFDCAVLQKEMQIPIIAMPNREFRAFFIFQRDNLFVAFHGTPNLQIKVQKKKILQGKYRS